MNYTIECQNSGFPVLHYSSFTALREEGNPGFSWVGYTIPSATSAQKTTLTNLYLFLQPLLLNLSKFVPYTEVD